MELEGKTTFVFDYISHNLTLPPCVCSLFKSLPSLWGRQIPCELVVLRQNELIN